MHCPLKRLSVTKPTATIANDRILNSLSTHEVILEAGRSERNYWRDIWRFRELFQMLAWRDVSVRYKQTAVGIAWSILRPLLTMIVFTIVFGIIAKLPTEGNIPYPVLVFAGMLPWTLLASALTECSNSLINNSNLISKVYFPRLIVAASTIVVALIDFAISLALLLLLMIVYRVAPSWQLITMPLFVLLTIIVSLGPGLWFASLNVKYRDFRFIVPFIVQFGLYVSPVGFSSSVIPDSWRLLYSLNPMVGAIDGFRWAILGEQVTVYWPSVAISLAIGLALLLLGIRQFRSLERQFADLI